ncbi:MAG: enoyl-CoA hydratase/isomerase family protein [Deltaproteobacteria bacterium]|nr:enoyl-CoA hydratase/isomerase family protein [Deltaproteobacteria bacterium]
MLNLHSKHIAEIVLNRPEALNAFNTQLLKELAQDLEAASEEDFLRVLIIRGAGEKAFSAGADLKERAKMETEETASFVHEINSVFDQVEDFPVPTIAFINGVALGGGLELALACDMRIAAPHALLGLPECSLGIIPGAGGTQRLQAVVGYAKAAELIFSARRLKADEALQIALVNRVSDNPDELAEEIARCSGNSLHLAKRAMITGEEWEAYEDAMDSPDRLEGLKSFQEKRKPVFE